MSVIITETNEAVHWAEMVAAGLLTGPEAQVNLSPSQRIEVQPAVVLIFDYRTKSYTVRAKRAG